jgi:hypothetical protein
MEREDQTKVNLLYYKLDNCFKGCVRYPSMIPKIGDAIAFNEFGTIELIGRVKDITWIIQKNEVGMQQVRIDVDE